MITQIMRPEHIGAVKELLDLCFNTTAWSVDSVRSQLDKPGSVCTVVTDGGRVIAYLAFEKILDEGSIIEIAVAPEYRRQGIARELINASISDNSLKEIYLEVRESNLPAISLYESLGFERMGVRADYYDCPKENAVIMKKTKE